MRLHCMGGDLAKYHRKTQKSKKDTLTKISSFHCFHSSLVQSSNFHYPMVPTYSHLGTPLMSILMHGHTSVFCSGKIALLLLLGTSVFLSLFVFSEA